MVIGYTRVRVNVGALIIDGIDADDVFDDVPVSGSMVLEPMLEASRPVQVDDNGRMKIKAIAAFTVDIGLTGEVSHRGKDYVTVPAPTSATSNVGSLQWRATFVDLKYGTQKVTVPQIFFWAEPGADVDLAEHISVAPASTAVQLSRGARGFGVVGAVPVDDGDMAAFAIEYQTNEGKKLSEPIPLPPGSGAATDGSVAPLIAQPGATRTAVDARVRAVGDRQFAPMMVPLRSLWQPYSTEVYPAADVLSDGVSTDVPGVELYPNEFQAVLWNDPSKLNLQSQRLVPENPSNVASGARNHPTARAYGGACFDVEFELTDDRFTVMTGMMPGWDMQVYVTDRQNQFRRLREKPLVYPGTSTSFGFRTVVFKQFRTRKIRIVGAFVVFYQILFSRNGNIRRTPDKDMYASIGDSFREALGMRNVSSSGTPSAESYHTMTVNDLGQERTGWAQVRLGLGGTGWFNNGSGTASEAPGPDGAVPFLSDANLERLKWFGRNNIRVLEINGTINDGELSGGKASMKARALAGLDKVYAWDAGLRVVIWGPEPYNDSVAGSVHDLNRQALMEVADEHPSVIGYIDTNNPERPFYKGTGSEAEPNPTSTQAKLTGMDGIHLNADGQQSYCSMGYDIMGEFLIERERVVVPT